MEKKLALERAEGLLHVESRDIVERYRTARVRLHWTKTKCLLAGGTRRTSMIPCLRAYPLKGTFSIASKHPEIFVGVRKGPCQHGPFPIPTQVPLT